MGEEAKRARVCLIVVKGGILAVASSTASVAGEVMMGLGRVVESSRESL